MLLSKEDIRAAGGIVHSDGNVFFTNIEQLNAAILSKLGAMKLPEPVAPNKEGATQCIVRWMVDTPLGWIGAYDKEAFDAYSSQAYAQGGQHEDA